MYDEQTGGGLHFGSPTTTEIKSQAIQINDFTDNWSVSRITSGGLAQFQINTEFTLNAKIDGVLNVGTITPTAGLNINLAAGFLNVATNVTNSPTVLFIGTNSTNNIGGQLTFYDTVTSGGFNFVYSPGSIFELTQSGSAENQNWVISLGSGTAIYNSNLKISNQLQDQYNSGGTSNQILTSTGTHITWATASGTLFGAQLQNTFFAGPSSGGSATPIFRTITTADLPSYSTQSVLYSNLSGIPTVDTNFNYVQANTSVGINNPGNQFANLRVGGSIQCGGFFPQQGFSFYAFVGTVSSAGTTVIGTGTTFTSNMVGGVILSTGIANTTAYTIIQFTNSTTLVISADAGFSATTFAIIYQGTTMDNFGNLSLGGNTYIKSKVYDSANSPGLAGQTLTSNGSQVLWTSSGNIAAVVRYNDQGISLASATNFLQFSGSNTVEGATQFIVTYGVNTIQNFYVNTLYIGGAFNDGCTYTINVNGINTIFSLAVDSSTPSNFDNVSIVSVSAGDLVSVQLTFNNPATINFTANLCSFNLI